MKTFSKLTLAVVVLVVCSFNGYAQKFGYINSQELIQAMPDYDSVQVKLEALAKEFQTQGDDLQREYLNKLQEYQKVASTLTDAVRQVKEKDLNDLRTRMAQLEQDAPAVYSNTQSSLMQPVFQKAIEAIDKVAKAGGYTAVFDIATGALAYYDKATMTDLLPLVKQELGIKDTPAAQ